MLHVHNATHLEWHFYRSSDKQLLDRVDIVQEQRWTELHAAAPQHANDEQAELRVQSG